MVDEWEKFSFSKIALCDWKMNKLSPSLLPAHEPEVLEPFLVYPLKPGSTTFDF